MKTHFLVTKHMGTLNGLHRIDWASIRFQTGILMVKVDDNPTHAKTIAELIAIQYLLFEKAVLGEGHIFEQLKLYVDSPLIVNFYNGCCKAKEWYSYAKFLLTRVFDASLFTINQTTTAKGLKCIRQLDIIDGNSELILVKKLSKNHSLLNCHALGEINISSHAIARFRERAVPNMNMPRSKLMIKMRKALFDIDLILLRPKIPIPSKNPSKEIQHLERWGRCTSGSRLIFVIARDAQTGIGTLLTVWGRLIYAPIKKNDRY